MNIFCKTSHMPAKFFNYPEKLYYNSYGISNKPIGEELESTYICNMDIDANFTIPFYKVGDKINPVPMLYTPFENSNFPNFLKYKYNYRCCVCGVNPCNAYYFPCRHGKICITCSLAYPTCLKCNSEYDIICRISTCPKDMLSDFILVAQPCGHLLQDTSFDECPTCGVAIQDQDVVDMT